MTDGRFTQGRVRAITEGGEAWATQLRVRTLYNFPSVEMRATQMRVRSFYASGPDLRALQLRVRVLIKGRVDDPRVRAWTFTLDGHDFYVLHLGTTETLIYDTFSGEWYRWGSGTSPLWRAYTGTNWQGGRAFGLNWSDVVVGDDGNGALYFLSPDDDYDDDAANGNEVPRPFRRRATGQVVVKSGYSSQPCFGVELFGSTGSGSTDDLTVKLEVSDDRGFTYTDMGDVSLDAADYNARVNWLSLGSMTAPGRLFRITDTGALKRIDKLDMD